MGKRRGGGANLAMPAAKRTSARKQQERDEFGRLVPPRVAAGRQIGHNVKAPGQRAPEREPLSKLRTVGDIQERITAQDRRDLKELRKEEGLHQRRVGVHSRRAEALSSRGDQAGARFHRQLAHAAQAQLNHLSFLRGKESRAKAVARRARYDRDTKAIEKVRKPKAAGRVASGTPQPVSKSQFARMALRGEVPGMRTFYVPVLHTEHEKGAKGAIRSILRERAPMPHGLVGYTGESANGRAHQEVVPTGRKQPGRGLVMSGALFPSAKVGDINTVAREAGRANMGVIPYARSKGYDALLDPYAGEITILNRGATIIQRAGEKPNIRSAKHGYSEAGVPSTAEKPQDNIPQPERIPHLRGTRPLNG